MQPKRVLIGSAVRQKPEILMECLRSLSLIGAGRPSIEFLFIDDNVEPSSRDLLYEFQRQRPGVRILDAGDRTGNYVCDGVTHVWNEALIWKVAAMKNAIISFALRSGYDFLLLVDSDLVLHPNTLSHLISTKKDIVSEIFWTKWRPGEPELPQVWVRDQYTLYSARRGEILDRREAIERMNRFLRALRKPGVYEVGGLGACTLISRKALADGVSFDEIPNVGFWGEDRHFCIRAAALGYRLYVDTTYPAYHIYRESDLPGARAYLRELSNAHTG